MLSTCHVTTSDTHIFFRRVPGARGVVNTNFIIFIIQIGEEKKTSEVCNFWHAMLNEPWPYGMPAPNLLQFVQKLSTQGFYVCIFYVLMYKGCSRIFDAEENKLDYIRTDWLSAFGWWFVVQQAIGKYIQIFAMNGKKIHCASMNENWTCADLPEGKSKSECMQAINWDRMILCSTCHSW